MADSNSSHEVALNATPGRRADTDPQETVPANGNEEAQIPADEDESEFLSRTDGYYTTVPTRDTHSLTSGKGTTVDAPELENDEPPPQQAKEKLIVLRPWLFELLALLLGVLSFAGIIAILVQFNGEAQLEFARHVNINTIIAILSTTLRAVIAFIATEVIGQSKWGWLETPHPLRHVEHLDNAGKGAWGSMKFLFFVSKPSLAVMGALLMIASYVLDPFSQQLAKTYSCNIPSGEEASIFVARRVSCYDSSQRPLMWLAAMTGWNGLNLSYGVAEISKGQLFRCPSGNCTFDPNLGITHTSVGMCSTCTDVTSDLTVRNLSNAETGYQLPWRPDLQLLWPPNSREWTYLRVRTENVKENNYLGSLPIIRSSVIAFSAAVCGNDSETSSIYTKARCRKMPSVPNLFPNFDNWKEGVNLGIVAMNCSLAPCLRRYRGRVFLGTLQEELVSQEPMASVFLYSALDYDSLWHMKFEPCEVKGRWYNSSNTTETTTDDAWVSWRDSRKKTQQAPEQCVMGISDRMEMVIREFQRQVIQGDANYRGYSILGIIGSNPDPATVPWLPSLARGGYATFESISASFHGMATGYTDFMRGDWEELKSERSKVNGTAWKSAVCIRADWPWLVYPAVLLVSTTTLLFAACVYSMREGGKRPVWKSTILPFLFYNLTMNRDQDRDPMDENGMHVPLLQLKGLERLADQTVARFSSNTDTPEFIVENSGTDKGGASAGQQVGLLRRLFKPRAG